MKHRGRVGPAALVGIGTAVIPEDPTDRQRVSVASVCSGTGEHMATTMAAATCADRLYHSVRKQAAGRMEFVTDSEAMEAVITRDFMGKLYSCIPDMISPQTRADPFVRSSKRQAELISRRYRNSRRQEDSGWNLRLLCPQHRLVCTSPILEFLRLSMIKLMLRTDRPWLRCTPTTASLPQPCPATQVITASLKEDVASGYDGSKDRHFTLPNSLSLRNSSRVV